MCLAIPGRVKKIIGKKAIVVYGKNERPALIGEEGVKEGDFVMVGMGVISRILTAEEAEKVLEVWKK